MTETSLNELIISTFANQSTFDSNKNSLPNNSLALIEKINSESRIQTNGWHKFDSGLIIQWGTSQYINQGWTDVNFSIAFPNEALCITVTPYINNDNNSRGDWSIIKVNTKDRTKMNVGRWGRYTNFFWIAIGH